MARVSDRRKPLIDAICTAFEGSARTLKASPWPDTPYHDFRRAHAEARAAVAALMLDHMATDGAEAVVAQLRILAAGHPLNDVAPEAAPKAIAGTIETLKRDLAAARGYWRDAYTVKTPAQAFARLLRRIELNDLEGVETELAAADSLTPFQAGLLTYKLKERRQTRLEADQVAKTLLEAYPEDSLRSGVSFWHLFRTRGRPDPGVFPAFGDPLEADPLALQRHLEILKLCERVEEGLALADRYAPLISTHMRLALGAAAMLMATDATEPAVRRTLLTAARSLPPVQQPSFFARFGYGGESDLAALLGRHTDLGMSAVPSLPLIEAAISQIDYAQLPEALRACVPGMFDLGLRQILDYDGPLRAEVRRQGACGPQDAAEAVRQISASRFDRDRSSALASVRGAVRARDAHMLRDLAEAGRPVLLYSTHTARIGMANYAPAILASDAGFDVMAVAGHAWISAEEQHRQAEDFFRKAGLSLRVLNTQSEDAASQSNKFLDHLSNGGALTITNDGLLSPGSRVFVPWLLRPFVLKTYAAQLALSKGAGIIAAFEWIDPGGDVQVDLTPVTSPPEQGSLKVRAMWLTQRCSRKIRSIVSARAVPFTYPELERFGGIPEQRELIALEDWAAEPGVQESVLGWLGGGEPKARIALEMPECRTGYSELRAFALRATALVLHAQSEKPQHGRSDRRPIDQHRVVVIVPKGPAMMALALGAMAAGSLISVLQDDLTPSVVRQRLLDFDPDLIIAGASFWASITQGSRDFDDRAVLICEDRGGPDALEDLLESFEPTDVLPPYAPDQPGLVVYTSGSSARPKAAVLAVGTLSKGSGLDKITGFSDHERVVMLTRWDAVGLFDLMACLRGEATIHVPPDAVVGTPNDMSQWLRAREISFLSAPVSIWSMLIASRDWRSGAPRQLRRGLLWGERIYRTVVERLEATAPDISLFSIYGATEYTYIGLGALASRRFDGLTGSPGGWPVGDTEVAQASHTADLALPSSAASTLVLTGVNAMIGYWSDVKFLPSLDTGGTPRTFVTEDHVILHPDGYIEILGRADAVIKMAGRRVAIVSIENAVESVDGVNRAMVFQIETPDGDRSALALEVPGDGDTAIVPTVLDAIKSALGSFALPNEIRTVDAFPKLPSGKVDRGALRAQFAAGGAASTATATAGTGKPSPALADLGDTLNALRSWAHRSGYCRPEDFDPGARKPEFSSIDVMEVMLLFEERFGRGISLSLQQLNGAESWRALAALADGIVDDP